MHKQVINQKTEQLLKLLAESKTIDNFYLAGGTALALQFGHRKSIDLDWFNKNSFDTQKLRKELSKIGQVVIEAEEKDTLDLTLSNVKLTFLGYSYNLLFPLINYQGIKLADYRDIACMKLDTVSSRGSKKDFIDLYFIFKEISFDELFELFEKKYSKIKFNKLHILKSLNYFIDADKNPMPIMIEDISWREVKNYFKNLTNKIL
ncbi:MAG: nucleotidyl transferase AbiEii/AbiGii toxin family protein [Patescibacteria group bacterium]|nr:nucleotidyl transferase AbiEii/AbiGii toxin family protein [Patescibacteria group bacterium]